MSNLKPQYRDFDPVQEHGLPVLASSDDHEHWLEVRRNFMSATQASVCAGSNPYQTIEDLYRERVEGIRPEFAPRQMVYMQFGTDSEQDIIDWVNTQYEVIGVGDYTITHDLVGNPKYPRYAVTPDAFRVNGMRGMESLSLIECKTSTGDWRNAGIPQHVIDQVIWQMIVTGARIVYVAQFRTKWGKGKTPEIIDRFLKAVEWDQARADFLMKKVDEYLLLEDSRTPPRLTIDVSEDEFDDTPMMIATKRAAREALDEVARLEDVIAGHAKDLDAAKATVKALTMDLIGTRRGVTLIGTQYSAKLVRTDTTTYDTKALDERTRQRITRYAERTTLRIEKN